MSPCFWNVLVDCYTLVSVSMCIYSYIGTASNFYVFQIRFTIGKCVLISYKPAKHLDDQDSLQSVGVELWPTRFHGFHLHSVVVYLGSWKDVVFVASYRSYFLFSLNIMKCFNAVLLCTYLKVSGWFYFRYFGFYCPRPVATVHKPTVWICQFILASIIPVTYLVAQSSPNFFVRGPHKLLHNSSRPENLT